VAQQKKFHKTIYLPRPDAQDSENHEFSFWIRLVYSLVCRVMQMMRRAVIDVGTNSIKLLVADVSGRDVLPVHEESRQTRLGQGFYDSHRLQPESIARTAEAVWEFDQIARDNRASSVRVVATSAARDAVNPGDLTSSIERACGLKTEIISGALEADWVFQGVTSDPELAEKPLLLLDVGGGSTELVMGQGTTKLLAHSFPLGTVRLLEKFSPGDPPTHGEFRTCQRWVKEFLKREIRPLMEPVWDRQVGELQLVGTGGTTSILARMEKKLDRFDRDKIDRTVLSFARVQAHRKNVWRRSLAQRKEIPGLPKLRADIILSGVLIYEALMEEFGFKQLRVSTRGLRFAAVMQPGFQ
jgi:exopolyphosphatase/guanosine-5'-triphosphate,3'-diphosphate pyrophosphatase